MKKVVYCFYVHKSNIFEIAQVLQSVHKDYELYSWLEKCILYMNSNSLKYEVIKVNIKDRTVSLIDSPDWDTAKEPTVGDSILFKLDGGIIKRRKGGTNVYHNKWQFVKDTYKGFDTREARERTDEWNSIPGIENHKSRIENKKYWHNLLLMNGLDV